MIQKGFKPWEIEADYAQDERIIKPEDKADILKLDQFSYNAEKNRSKKKTGLQDLIKGKGLDAGKELAKELPKSW